MSANSGITNEEIEQKWAELNADDGDIRIMAMLHELLERRKSKNAAHRHNPNWTNYEIPTGEQK